MVEICDLIVSRHPGCTQVPSLAIASTGSAACAQFARTPYCSPANVVVVSAFIIQPFQETRPRRLRAEAGLKILKMQFGGTCQKCDLSYCSTPLRRSTAQRLHRIPNLAVCWFNFHFSTLSKSDLSYDSNYTSQLDSRQQRNKKNVKNTGIP
jgi:hypothetical protein